jgi:hypothetical protein
MTIHNNKINHSKTKNMNIQMKSDPSFIFFIIIFYQYILFNKAP